MRDDYQRCLDNISNQYRLSIPISVMSQKNLLTKFPTFIQYFSCLLLVAFRLSISPFFRFRPKVVEATVDVAETATETTAIVVDEEDTSSDDSWHQITLDI